MGPNFILPSKVIQMSNDHSMNEYAKKLLEQSRTPAEFLVPPKIYFHHHNYAKFHVDLGGSRVKSLAFANYRLITDDKREQDQLDLVADVPGSFIYTMADSDVDAVIRQELAQEMHKDVMRTALAQSQVNGQQFDPNAPIIPVQVQHVQSTPMQVRPVQQTPAAPQPAGAVVGLQNSFSGSQAVDGVGGVATTTDQQTKPPSAADAAAARLAAMTAEAQKNS
jgi:hypothetical protein